MKFDSETALKCVRSAASGVLYADDVPPFVEGTGARGHMEVEGEKSKRNPLEQWRDGKDGQDFPLENRGSSGQRWQDHFED